MITALAVGAVFIMIGIVFAITPDLTGRIGDFFSDMTTVAYPPGSATSNVFLPAPGFPATHETLYAAVAQFALGIGILQIVILALRLILHSPVQKTAETVGNLIFWFGAAFLILTLLVQGTTVTWFQYWAAIIMLIGTTAVVRGGLIHLAARKKTRSIQS